MSNRVVHSREFEADQGECGSKTLIGSAIVAIAAAIVTVVERQQSWSEPLPWPSPLRSLWGGSLAVFSGLGFPRPGLKFFPD